MTPNSCFLRHYPGEDKKLVIVRAQLSSRVSLCSLMLAAVSGLLAKNTSLVLFTQGGEHSSVAALPGYSGDG